MVASEPEGRGAAWTKERGTSDDGRLRLKAPWKRAGDGVSGRKAIAGRTLLVTTAAILVATTVVLAGKGMSAASPGCPGGSAELLISPVPQAAGNLPRFAGVFDRPVNFRVIGPYQQRFEDLIGGPRPGYLQGLYGMPGLADPATNGVAWVMYLGYNEPAPITDPPAMASRLMTALAGPVRSWATAAGPAGGSARCAHTRYSGIQVAICDWATAATIGAVMSPARTTSLAGLATLLRQMRPDLAGMARPASFP